MVNLQKNIQWWWSGSSKTIEKPLLAMVPRKKNITIASFEKNDHRRSLVRMHLFGNDDKKDDPILKSQLVYVGTQESHGELTNRQTPNCQYSSDY